MSSWLGRTSIDEKIRMKLWAVSGGRCEMCNRLLYEDSTFGVEGNFGEMAHIHAVSDNGPRNKRGMTSEEKNNIENLMLLCSEHHHMVDTKPEEFGDGLLKTKKKNHEDRIRRVTDIPEEESCRIVSYFSNIDKYEEYSTDRLFKEALLFSGKLPMQQPTINLNANTNVRYAPSQEEFERKGSDLEREFKIWFDAIIKQQDSVGLFALAPQPLLFKLGSLITDQYNVSVYQCHRRANKWSWVESDDEIEFKFYKTLNNNDDEIALVIDLSAAVDDERITSVLGDNISVFHLSIETPNRSFVTNENIQSAFVEYFRNAMEKLKNLKKSKGVIHVFPVMPNSLAIKAGMDYMPKADLPLVIYEQSKVTEGFFEALTIGG